MKKIILILTYFTVIFCLNAQDKVAVLETNYQSNYYTNKESLAISNYKTDELIILVEDSEETYLYLLDENFETKKKLTTPSLLSSFKNFIGYSISDTNDITIFFSNNSKKKFGTLSFNFEKNSVSQKKLDLKFKKEKVVEGISNQNKFYLLTANSSSDTVNFYEYADSSKTFNKHEVSFSELNYRNEDGYTIKPHKLLRGSGNITSASSKLKKINFKIPNPIEATAEKSKLYQIENQLVFSFDHRPNETLFIKINTDDFSKKVKRFNKPKFDSSPITFAHHNSFLHDNIVYQLMISDQEMKFTAKQFLNKNLLKEITLNKTDSIRFKNGPIIQEGAANALFADRVRKLEKTSKFLRKVASGKTGISVYTNQNNLQIELGSYKEYRSGGAPIAGIPGGFGATPLGSFSTVSPSFNPVFGAYGGYKNSKSTHIKCVFDKKFNHIKGKPAETIFEKIKKFEGNFKKKHTSLDDENIDETDEFDETFVNAAGLKLRNVFLYKNKTYFSYLNTKDKQYHIVEFTTQ